MNWKQKLWLVGVVALGLTAYVPIATAQQKYDTNGAARTSTYFTTTTPGDTAVSPTNPLPTSTTSAPSSSSSAGITPVVSSAAEGSHVLKASAGNLYGLSATSGASAGYVMVFNATSAPADGAVTPIFCYSIPATSSLGSDYSGAPAVFATGITIVFSTTGCFTKTISATAFFAGSVK